MNVLVLAVLLAGIGVVAHAFGHTHVYGEGLNLILYVVGIATLFSSGILFGINLTTRNK